MSLVLSRKAGEAIFLNNDICVRIGGVRGQQVRLVIDAPESVRVAREELRRPKLGPEHDPMKPRDAA